MIESEFKLFKCICGYEGLRTNNNTHCKRCGKDGKLIKLLVKVGDVVHEDDEILILEAMKMEMPILAEKDGIIKEINVFEGQTVETDQTLVILN